jgi:hypothetical protein
MMHSWVAAQIGTTLDRDGAYGLLKPKPASAAETSRLINLMFAYCERFACRVFDRLANCTPLHDVKLLVLLRRRMFSRFDDGFPPRPRRTWSSVPSVAWK